ncbi:hypothetical protein QYE76_060465 [Lolium multiflorum]|uniref:BACK domain-containing protein n=1 Tax=Lolium multiflorum TaxID=4521 RepID=A0AAD8S1A9_LOLMU|nr:hypothetical protein QYE76_060465 [Lolium multiflorum]
MDLDFSSWGAVPSFEFAFNSENFSDRVLQLEVVPCDDDGGESLPDSARTPKEKEENAVMELLGFMYRGKLTSREPTLLLDILMAADKFEVLSCMRHCSQLLSRLRMNTESALLYLDHPCSVLMVAEVQCMVGAAKEFLTDKYKDVDKFGHEVMNFPLAGIEAIFSSTDIQVESEDHVYRFLLKWVRARYLELEERRDILSCRLLPLVRFNHMACTTVQEILACTDDDIDHEKVSKLITKALLHKAYPTVMEGVLSANLFRTCWPFAERGYKTKPVKVVVFDPNFLEAIVYLGLTREECSRLFPLGKIWSQTFYLAGQEFRLVATCKMDEISNSYSFGLYVELLWMPERSKSVMLAFQFAARKEPTGKFISQPNNYLKICTFRKDDLTLGCDDVFEMPWSTFVADDSLFINGVLHLRADLTVLEIYGGHDMVSQQS